MTRQRGMAIPWPALLICAAFAGLAIWLGHWWGAAFFGGLIALSLLLDLAVRMSWLRHPDDRWSGVEAKRKRAFKVRAPAPPAAPPPPRPAPKLEVARQARVRHVVATLSQYGLFRPEAPDPALLFAGIADNDLAGDVADVLAGLEEVPFYHPGVDPQRWLANCSLHGTQCEQDVGWQLVDLARLVDGTAAIVPGTVETGPTGQIRAAWTVDGVPHETSWQGHPKYLSTHLHVAIARIVRAAGTGRRLAWLWDDMGAYVSLLDDGAVEALNAALGLEGDGPYRWDWIDQAEPFAAG